MLNAVPETELALVERLVAGERAALAPLYARYKDRIYRFALAFCASRDLAADATQETFLQFATQPHHYDPRQGALGAYLCGVVRNIARGLTRETLREVQDLETDTPTETAWTDDSAMACPLTQVLRDERAQIVHHSLRQLPAHYREALILVELQEESYASASQILGVPIGTVRSRLARGKALLAGQLAELATLGEPTQQAKVL
jgi:RNA polymerase sigma-70 factor, ECF subfamily